MNNQKLLLGPQIPKSTPRYEDIVSLFKSQASLDTFLSATVFVIGIVCESEALEGVTSCTSAYKNSVLAELDYLRKRIIGSKLNQSIRITLIYIPILNKDSVVSAFDVKLKGLQA